MGSIYFKALKDASGNSRQQITDITNNAFVQLQPGGPYQLPYKSFIRALEDIKSYLIKEGTHEEVVKQKIDIKVLNVKDATLVINNKGFVGSELTHYVLPGESVNISVVKQNYLSINKEFICNADRIINITLKKKTNILAIILSAIFILILFTLTINKYL